MRISDWSSDVCSSDLPEVRFRSLGSPVGFAGDGSGAKPSRKMIGPNNRYAKYECLTRLPELIDNDAAQPAEPGIGLRRLMPVKIAAAGLDRQRQVEKLHRPHRVEHRGVRSGEREEKVDTEERRLGEA